MYVPLDTSGTIHHMIFIYDTMCKMITSPGIFFVHLFKTLIFWVVRRVTRGKIVQNDKKFSHLNYLNYHMIVICDTQV